MTPMTALIPIALWTAFMSIVIYNLVVLNRLRKRDLVPQPSPGLHIDIILGRYDHIPEIRRARKVGLWILCGFIVGLVLTLAVT